MKRRIPGVFLALWTVSACGDDQSTVTFEDTSPESDTNAPVEDTAEAQQDVTGDVSACEQAPCMYDGTCIPQGAGFTCECQVGRVGPRCESIEFTLKADIDWFDLDLAINIPVDDFSGIPIPPPDGDISVTCCSNKSLIELGTGASYAVLGAVDYDAVTVADSSNASFASANPEGCEQAWEVGSVYLVKTEQNRLYKVLNSTETATCQPTLRYARIDLP